MNLLWILRRITAAVIALVMLISGAAQSSAATAVVAISSPEQAPLTTAQIYRRVQRSLLQPGMLYHATVQRTLTDKDHHMTGSIEQWVDARADTAREEYHMTGDPRPFAMILTPSATYLRSPDPNGARQVQTEPSHRCSGAGVAVTATLFVDSSSDCLSRIGTAVLPGFATQRTVVRQGRYAGQPALIVQEHRVTGPPQGSGPAAIDTSYSRNLYLDPDTFLPILQMTTTADLNMRTHARSNVSTQRVRYAHSFVPATSVAANLFDPASIGYAGPESQIQSELKPVPSTFTVYWLGVRFHAPPGLPDLVANRAVASPSGGPSFSLELYYTLTSDPYGLPTVYMEESSSDPARRMHPPSGSCFAREAVQVSGVRAVIVTGAHPGGKRCSSSMPATAFVSFTRTSIVIQAPTCCGPHNARIVNPYNSRSGMEMVVRALQRRVQLR